MEEGSVAVLVDAKEEYTKQLISIIKPCIYQGIKSIYNDAKDICNQDNTPDNALMVFQDLLSRVPKWSQDIINKEYDRISSISKCDYIDDLVKVVYVSHIKVLTIVHSAQKNKKISLKVPSGSHFIHLCYIECAREFWKDPYLFSDRVSKYELQKNMRDSENMISECISETIRKQLPVRHILKEFLNEPDEEIEENDDIKEPVNTKYLKKLETVVKKELKTSNKDIDLNVELIRKVIREELDSRPALSTIKKELVDTVVEKIVEQSNNDLPSNENISSNNNNNNNNNTETNINDIANLPLPIHEPETDNTNAIALDNTNLSTLDNTNATTLDNTNLTTDSIITINKELNDKLALNLNNENIEKNNDIDSDPEIINNNSLDNLLNDTENKKTDNVIDIKTSSSKNEIKNYNNNSKIQNEKETKKETKNETKNGTETETKKETKNETETEIEKETKIEIENNDEEYNSKYNKKLVINNIDEVNLNLDELDSELGGDLDLDSLQTIDLKPSRNEVKKDPNTKYIFFNDN